MKVLIGADTYYPHVNGASYFAQRLAHYLCRRGHSVKVVAPSRRIFNEGYQQNGVRVTGVRSMPVLLYKDFRISPRMLEGKIIEDVMLTWQPEVVHVQGHFFVCKEVLRVAREMGLPTVGTNHFMPENLVHYLHLPGLAAGWLKSWAWKKFRSVFEEIDIVTTPTKTAAQLLQQIGLKKEVLAISCGIDLGRFCPSAEMPDLKPKYAIPAGKKILLYVGRLDKEKNIDLILRGFARAEQTMRTHCVIAGRGAEEGRLKKLVGQLGLEGKVTFTGFVPDDDLPALYALADCFIIAGTAELQSIVTMEAMASGLPVIAVRAMALPELIQPGVSGCLFDPGDEVGVADCITAVLGNNALREKLAQGSLKIIKRHNIENTIDQFEALYRNLLYASGKKGKLE